MNSAPHTNVLLRRFSIELTPGDEKSIKAAERLPKGTEVFIANLPKGSNDAVIEAASRLRKAGLTPVPHIAARNMPSDAELDRLLRQLADRVGVDRALVIAGDRDDARGPYSDSLAVLKSGLLQGHGIEKVYLSCYPEGHPRIDAPKLSAARTEKVAVAEAAGLAVGFISQFCFEAPPFLAMARELRDEGFNQPLRLGLAGPTGLLTLAKYAALCGVGPSIRALRERSSLATGAMAGSTEELLAELGRAAAADPSLRIGGIHFFTFGALARTADFIDKLTNRVGEFV
jgi:methylenetetrahydrofolate reductase (NADPH)